MIKTLEQLSLDLDNARMFFIRTVAKEDKENYKRALDVYHKASDDYTRAKFEGKK